MKQLIIIGILSLVTILVLLMIPYEQPTEGFIDFDVSLLNDLDYSSESLYYNISYEEVDYDIVNENSDIILVVEVTKDGSEKFCKWKTATFSVLDTLKGTWDNDMNSISYPVEYYNETTRKLEDYEEISDGIYILFLKELNDEYSVAYNFNGFVNLTDNYAYNIDVEAKSLLNYYINGNGVDKTQMIDTLIINNTHIYDFEYINKVFSTKALIDIILPHYYDIATDTTYLKFNGNVLSFSGELSN
ncbi:hypothetical protein [Candidatus Izimaplasma sp. ZiA1]|uniref:hypothetical protein n=1 Tax=Candidatus Izimoplasma sp. ZiA1 TaxID=2024899 RepID=UPI001178592D